MNIFVRTFSLQIKKLYIIYKMITLKTLHIENFMSIDCLDLEFSNNQITAITGQNGSGKSSLIYAVALALTGYKKGESYKDYIKTGRDFAKVILETSLKGFPAIFDIEVNGDKKKAGTLNRKVTYKGKTYLNSEFSQFIESEGLEELETLMFMFQGYHDIIDLKPSERANLLKKLFKFEFPEIVDGLKKDQEQYKRESLEQNAKIEELKSRIFTHTPLLREMPQEGINSLEEKLLNVTKVLEDIGDIDEASITKCDIDIKSTEKEILDITRKIDSDKVSLDSQKRSLTVSEEFIQNNPKDALSKDLEGTEKELEDHKIRYREQKEKDKELNDELKVTTYKVKELEGHYNISKTGVCHSCGQPIDAEYLSNLEKKLDSTKKDMESLKKSIKDLNFDKSDSIGKALEKKRDNIKSTLREIEYYESSIEAYKERINDLTSLIEERSKALSLSKEKLETLKQKRVELDSLNESIKERDNLIKEKSTIQEKLQTARDNKVKNIERRNTNDRIDREIIERDSRVKELTERTNTLSISLNKVKQEIDIFETKFPNFIVLQACQKLEDIINSIVQKVFPYCRVSLKLSKGGINFFYTSESSEEEWIPVSMASGAQRRTLSLAYFIALAKLSNISCIFLDEMDASMSPENAGIVYDFIGGLDYFDQVFFISHRKEAHEAVKARNDKLITYLVENGNYSEI